MTDLPASVKIVEVGARDGLQNEPRLVPAAIKIDFINRLSEAGLKSIEVTSFVSPRWIPQLADASAVFDNIDRVPGVAYPVLVPNEEGMRRALRVGVEEVAVFSAASETFNRKNINATIAEAMQRFEPVMGLAQDAGIKVRGYVSCVIGCPYEGDIDPERVAAVAEDMYRLGCYEISLGDTIGVGTPVKARRMLEATARRIGMEHLAVHFHDTRGQALANVFACLESGVAVVDASVAGLGGCPYAAGATGNVATEDLLYMLDGLGIETGVDLAKLIDAGRFISEYMERPPNSRLGAILRTAPDASVKTGHPF